MEKVLEKLQHAYNITDEMTVKGGAVEQLALLRQALREAYAAAKESDSGEDDGK